MPQNACRAVLFQAPLKIQNVAGLVGFDCGGGSGLEKGPVQAHIAGMSTIVQCNCGAEYRRTEEKFLIPHTGDAVCMVCGPALESWLESTHVPTYELIERPDSKPG